MMLPRLSFRSLWNRRGVAALTVVSVAFSVALLMGVEKVRTAARDSFIDTISATDLIVGARAGGVQLLLYSVFRIGSANNDISYVSYKDVASRPEVAWAVPITLGDSHQGFRVVGTTTEFFDRYRYRAGLPLRFGEGKPFSDLFDAVIGADVAETLGYKVGTRIIISHGLASIGTSQLHADKPFVVSGVLAKTGTPVDRSVHISLEAIEAIHVDWVGGAPPRPGEAIPADVVRQMDLTPRTVTAALIGVKSRLLIFNLQRFVNEYKEEALTAILPGVALIELWSIVGAAELALIVVSSIVVATAIMGMVISILASLNERRREMAILRSVGLRPTQVFGLLFMEAGFLAVAGCLVGLGLLYVTLFIVTPIIDQRYGLFIGITPPSERDILVLGIIVAAGFIAGIIPAIRAYTNSIADGIIVRT
jgi:putative ABC transport system permease protein